MKIKKFISVILIAMIAVSMISAVPASAFEAAPTRTVMLYCVGSTLESSDELATKNLIQAMESDYNEDVKIVVMTGGAKNWHTPSEYLSGAESIDPEHNQIWELDGKRSAEEHGKMLLLEGQGNNIPMSNPDTLTSFLDYCYEKYPADNYDLILWDHGGGPAYGFGYDYRGGELSLGETVKALSESRLIGDGHVFELIDYDACLMGSIEVVTALSDYTDCLICSPEEIPGGGQDYTVLMNALADSPLSGMEIGKVVTDDFVSKYKDSETNGKYAIMAAVNTSLFKERMLPLLNEFSGILLSEAAAKGDNSRYNFYDEIYSRDAAYEYGSERYSLVDLGSLLSALSCRQIEDGDALDDYTNHYTDTAKAIFDLINTDSIIYCGKSDILKAPVKGWDLRGSNGEISALRDTEGAFAYPTGLNIFFPSDNAGTSFDYVKAMKETGDSLPGGNEKRFLEQYTSAVACYSLISVFGDTVYDLAESGIRDATYNEVKYSLRQKGIWNRYLTYIISYLSDYVFSNESETEEYLREIVDQQALEIITADDVAVENKNLIINDGSDQAITGISSELKVFGDPSDLEFRTLLSLHGYNYSGRNRFFPDGFAFTLSNTSYSRAASGREIKAPPERVFALYDSEGVPHIADIRYTDDSHNAGYIPIVVLKGLSKETNYYLYVSRQDGEWMIDGLSRTIGSSVFIPMDSSEFTDERGEIAFATVSSMTDAVYGKTTLLPISDFSAVDNTQSDWGILARELKLKDMPEPYTYSEQYSLTDVYGNVTDITDIVKAARSDILGDVDGDGEVTIIDATFIQRQLASIPLPLEFNDSTADTDADGEVTIIDATYIQRWLASLPSNERIGKPIQS